MENCFGSEKTADSINPSTTTPHTSSFRPSTQGWTSTSWLSTVGSDNTPANGEILASANLKVYSFSDLKSATKSFRPDLILGTGGFGTVFKGWVDEHTLAPSKYGVGMTVAIKKLSPESTRGFRSGRLSHPNVVKLLGYCLEDKELLLVYEFMPKGSLENHLFRRNVETLSWEIRLKIAIGAARALAFLHTSSKKVIYRDFKASNILLDGNYNAKISDFGLAKLGPSGGNSHVTTRIMGTYGYAAPEYIATGHLYVESDVYGFGVVLLEMLNGTKSIRRSTTLGATKPGGMGKTDTLSKEEAENHNGCSDRRTVPNQGSIQASELTLRCIDEEPRNQPSMKQVVEILEQIEAVEKPKD